MPTLAELTNHELHRQNHNCAMANGLFLVARQIDRVMKAYEREWGLSGDECYAMFKEMSHAQ